MNSELNHTARNCLCKRHSDTATRCTRNGLASLKGVATFIRSAPSPQTRDMNIITSKPNIVTSSENARGPLTADTGWNQRVTVQSCISKLKLFPKAATFRYKGDKDGRPFARRCKSTADSTEEEDDKPSQFHPPLNLHFDKAS